MSLLHDSYRQAPVDACSLSLVLKPKVQRMPVLIWFESEFA